MRKREVFLSFKGDLAKVFWLHIIFPTEHSYILYLVINTYVSFCRQFRLLLWPISGLIMPFSKSWDAESKLAASDKALAEAEKKYKESLFRLAKAERGKKSTDVALGRAKRQAEELWSSFTPRSKTRRTPRGRRPSKWPMTWAWTKSPKV